MKIKIKTPIISYKKRVKVDVVKPEWLEFIELPIVVNNTTKKS